MSLGREPLRESNPPSRGTGEVSDVFTTDRDVRRGTLETASPLEGVACSTAEQRRGLKTIPGGVEPPTLRLPMQPISSPPANRIGGEPTMLSMPLRAEPCGSRDSNPFGAEAPFHEVTVIFTTAASARRARSFEGAGEQAILGEPRAIRGALLSKRSQPATHQPCQADSTARSIGGGTEPAFPWERSIQNLHHQRMSSHARETSHNWY